MVLLNTTVQLLLYISISSITATMSLFPSPVMAYCSALPLCPVCIIVITSRCYVLNPTTQQYSTIPRPVNGDQYDHIVSINLAFDPSLSLHYKIIALISRRDRSPEYRIAVYSSETRTWVNSVPVIYPSDMIIANGVFSDGKIHWLRCCSETSIAYDIN
ncbi:hypothetical protein HYC85_003797 [Camellia sinensis]|uniref:F-box associated beta-propeller type 1 domain-containing protein n=1 Tax=Camellia sinensis TaxID=4442 RepID=A0A7J7HUP2_CAMSI|nr:hypothetical protein HYC85_003797 [Camellia sinensis]